MTTSGLSRIACFAGFAGIVATLVATTGCLIISARVPDVHVRHLPPGDPPVECGTPVRHKPYAAALDRVLRQEARVSRELRKRDWEEVDDELADWQKYTRRLAGVADTSHDPAVLRAHCATLHAHVETMRSAQRHWDATVIEQELEEARPLLDRMSSEFPLTEPVAAQAAGPAEF